MVLGSNGQPTESEPFLRGDCKPSFRLCGYQKGGLVLMITCMSAIGGFLFGYDTGVVSGALLQIKDDFGMTKWQSEVVVSVTTLGAVIGSLVGGPTNERMGRKPVIVLSSFIFTLGALGMGAAPTFQVLVMGRFVIGLAIGLSSMTIPVYIAEAAPPEIRGRLVTINICFITGGQFIAGMVDGLFAETPQGWRYMLGLAAFPAILQLIGFLLYMPESPRWLVKKGRIEEASSVLFRLRDGDNVDEELEEIRASVEESEDEEDSRDVRFRDLLATPPIRRALFLGCGLMLLQQLSGINTVMYYSATIYSMAGFGKTVSIWLAGFTAGAQFVGMVANMLMVERFGRRTLVLTSLVFVAISLMALGTSFYLNMIHSDPVLTTDTACSTIHNIFVGNVPVNSCFRCVELEHCGFCSETGRCSSGTSGGDEEGVCMDWSFGSCDYGYGYLSVISMVAYLLAFGIGMGAMPWTINAEIYPLHVRSLANSVATSVNWIGNVAVSATFLTLASVDVLTEYGAFWLYAFITVCGLVGLYITLPETKGLHLEEIQKLFTRPWDPPSIQPGFKPISNHENHHNSGNRSHPSDTVEAGRTEEGSPASERRGGEL